MMSGKAGTRKIDSEVEVGKSPVRDISVFDFDDDDGCQTGRGKRFRTTPARKRSNFHSAFRCGRKQSRRLSALERSCSVRMRCQTITPRNRPRSAKARRKCKNRRGQRCGKEQLMFDCQQTATSLGMTNGFSNEKLDELDIGFDNPNLNEVAAGVNDEDLPPILLCSRKSLEALSTGSDKTGLGVSTGKYREVAITAEQLFLWENFYISTAHFTFTADTIMLEMEGNSSPECKNRNAIQWSIDQINSFDFYDNEDAGYTLLELGLTNDGAQLINSHFKGASLDATDDCKLLLKLNCHNWHEQQRQITALSDHYKYLWRPLVEDEHSNKIQGLLRRVEAEQVENVSGGNAYPRSSCGVCMWMDIVYPKEDPDAVTITQSDFQLLNPMEFLSDTIIDFYIKYLQSTLVEEHKRQLYFFNSFFFRKLTEYNPVPGLERHKTAFDGVKRWTAKINIFEKDYLFLPIMQSAHWSLIIICYPGHVLSDDQDGTNPKACRILHLDSLDGCHLGLEEPIRNYLVEAWIQKFGCDGDHVDAACKRWSTMEFIHAKVPQQTNYSDCGLFLLHYVELFIQEIQKEEFSHFLTEQWFDPAEASAKRFGIRNLIIKMLLEALRENISDVDLSEGELILNAGHELQSFLMNHEMRQSYFSPGGSLTSVDWVPCGTNCVCEHGCTSVSSYDLSAEIGACDLPSDAVVRPSQVSDAHIMCADHNSLSSLNQCCQPASNVSVSSYHFCTCGNDESDIHTDSILRSLHISDLNARSADDNNDALRAVHFVPMQNESSGFFLTGSSDQHRQICIPFTSGSLTTSVGQIFLCDHLTTMEINSNAFVCVTPEHELVSYQMLGAGVTDLDIRADPQNRGCVENDRELEAFGVAVSDKTADECVNCESTKEGSGRMMPDHVRHFLSSIGFDPSGHSHLALLNTGECRINTLSVSPCESIDYIHYGEESLSKVHLGVSLQNLVEEPSSSGLDGDKLETVPGNIKGNFDRCIHEATDFNHGQDNRQCLSDDKSGGETTFGTSDTGCGVDACQASLLEHAQYISSDDEASRHANETAVESLLDAVLTRKDNGKMALNANQRQPTSQGPITRSKKLQDEKSNLLRYTKKRQRHVDEL